MKCPSDIELNDYIENRLPTRRCWELQGHLRACPRCQAAMQTLAQSTECLDALRHVDTSSADHPSLEDLASLREKRLAKSQQAALLAHLSLCPECAFIFGRLPRHAPARMWERHWQPLAAAASFILILAVAFVAWQQGYISRSDVPLTITQHYEHTGPPSLEIPAAESPWQDQARALGKGATRQGEAVALPADKTPASDGYKPAPVAKRPSRAPVASRQKTVQRRPAFLKPPTRSLPPEKRVEKSQEAWQPKDSSPKRAAVPFIPFSGRRTQEKSLLPSPSLSAQAESVWPRAAGGSAPPAAPEPPPLAQTIQAPAPASAPAPMAASKAISPDTMETKRFGAAPSSRNVLEKTARTAPKKGKPKLSVAAKEAMRAQPLQAPLAPAKATRGAGLAPEQTREEFVHPRALPAGGHNPLAIFPLALAELKNERIAKDYIKDLDQ